MTEKLTSLIQTLLSRQNLSLSSNEIKFLFAHARPNDILAYFLSSDKKREYLALGRYKTMTSSQAITQNKEEMAFGSYQFHGEATFIVPDYLITRESQTCRFIKYNEKASPLSNYFASEVLPGFSQCQNITELPTKEQWNELIDKTTNVLKNEDKSKVVLGKLISLEFDKKREAKYDFLELIKLMPGTHQLFLSLKPSLSFISLSPETLYRRVENNVFIDTLAGTRARGKTKEDDLKLENDLLTNKKDLEEHHIVSESIVKNIQSLGKVEVGKTQVKKFANVQHLFTPIKLYLKNMSTPLKLADRLHPTPALGGSPKQWAIDYINHNEPFKRDYFAAPLGMISYKQEELIVGIRSALINKKSVSLFGGCGIVKESKPELEWQEINDKIGFLKDYFTGGLK